MSTEKTVRSKTERKKNQVQRMTHVIQWHQIRHEKNKWVHSPQITIMVSAFSSSDVNTPKLSCNLGV